MTPLRVTLDTGVVNEHELPRITVACQGREVDIAHTTVTEREQKGTGYASGPGEVLEEAVWDESPWDGALWGTTRIYETFVIGESPIGSAQIGSDDERSMFHAILDVIGDGGFPPRGKRGELTPGQHAQLRDAMILLAHARDGRDVFITKDLTAFVHHGRKARLEALCSTRIMTPDEFVEWIANEPG